MTEKQDEIRLKELLSVFGNDKKKELIQILHRDQIRYHKEQLTLTDVSQQRERLVAYEKHHYTPSEWALASKQCEKEIDDFLATNCG